MSQNSITEADLDILFKDLENRRKEIEEDARAIARVKKMMQARNGALPFAQPLFPSENIESSKSFTGAVRNMVRQFGSQGFTILMIVEQLTKQGVKLPGKKTNQRIWMVLDKMRRDNTIVITTKGIGNAPNVYRVA